MMYYLCFFGYWREVEEEEEEEREEELETGRCELEETASLMHSFYIRK